MIRNIPRWGSWVSAVAVLGSWAISGNAADYNVAFVRAKRCAEAAVGSPLDVTLEIRAFTGRDRLPESEYGGSPVAFYEPESRSLAVDPSRCRTALLAQTKTVREMNDVIFVLLLHELLHAYQAEVISRLKGEGRCDAKWLRFLCEGHAIHFSRALALKDGVDRTVLDRVWGSGPRERFSDDTRQAAESLRFRLYYVESASFVEKRCKRASDFEVLLPIARNPFGYAQALGHLPAKSSERPTELLRQFLDKVSADAARVDYLEAMAAVAPKAFPSPDVIGSFRGAAAAQYSQAATKQTISVVVVLFTTPDAARKCIQIEYGERAVPARVAPMLAIPGPRVPGQGERATVQIGTYIARVVISPAGNDPPLTLPLVKQLLSELSQDVGTNP